MNDDAKKRVVIDTQVILRAALNLKSLPAKVFFDLRTHYQLVTSEPIINEVRDVLTRPKLRRKFPPLDDAITDQVLLMLEAANKIETSEVKPVSRDPKDDIFLACAKEGQAQYLVSEDQALLVLDPYENTRILNVLEFYRLIVPGN